MKSIIDDIKKLPVAERASLFLVLKKDSELKEFLHSAQADDLLFEEIARRDKSFEAGEMNLTSVEDLAIRLKARRDAL